MDVSRLFKNIEESNLGKSIPLDKSNDYDVALTTSHVTHPTHPTTGTSLIAIGTYGQEVLIYKAESGELISQFSMSNPILSILPCRENFLAVMTNKCVEIIKIE